MDNLDNHLGLCVYFLGAWPMLLAAELLSVLNWVWLSIILETTAINILTLIRYLTAFNDKVLRHDRYSVVLISLRQSSMILWLLMNLEWIIKLAPDLVLLICLLTPLSILPTGLDQFNSSNSVNNLLIAFDIRLSDMNSASILSLLS